MTNSKKYYIVTYYDCGGKAVSHDMTKWQLNEAVKDLKKHGEIEFEVFEAKYYNNNK